MAYSEGDGLRSVGQLDSKQKGSFVESPFPGFPICLIDEGAKGLDGFASAALASAGLGKGPCPPFRLMDWKGSRWSHICPQPWHLLWLGCQQMLGSHLLHPARCGGKATAPSPRRVWGMLRLQVNQRRKLQFVIVGMKDWWDTNASVALKVASGCTKISQVTHKVTSARAKSQGDCRSPAKNASKPE